MKHFLLFSALLLMFSVVYSQQRVKYTAAQKEKVIRLSRPDMPKGLGTLQNPQNPSVSTTSTYWWSEQVIGTTHYDLLSQGCLSNKITAWEDGTIAAVWTLGFEEIAFPDRGTGYNYYNNDTWGTLPTSRIETVKTGSPSHTDYLTNAEIIVAHNAVDALVFNTRPVKGTGAWTSFNFQGPGPDWHELLWAKIVTSGENNAIMQLLASTTPSSNNGQQYNGMDPALLYSRSTDGGSSWNPENIQLPGITNAEYLCVPVESYAWAEPIGNTIAFMVSDTWQSDMFIMKSEDNGETWTKTIIWQHPYPLFDWDVDFTDTLWAPDGSHDVALDSEGNVHCVAGICRIRYYMYGFQYDQWPYGEGIAYWNENRPPFEAPNGNPHDALDAWNVLVDDYNLIGWSPDLDGNGVLNLLDEIFVYDNYIGLSTMPNLVVDEAFNVHLLYSTTTETYDNGFNNFKHIWHRQSMGSDWSEPEHMTGDLIHIFDENIFPSFAKRTIGNYGYFSFMSDTTPGLAIMDMHPYQENRIYTNRTPWVGLDEEVDMESGFIVSQVILSPDARDYFILVELNISAEIGYEIYNTVGQKVRSKHSYTYSKGKHKLDIDLSGLENGVYFCSVVTGKQKSVRKIIK